MKKIDKKLLPEIECDVRYENKEGYDSPLLQLLKDEKYKDKSFYLTAQGGTGKTTTLFSLWLDYLCGKHDIPCVYIDLKMLDKNAVKPIENYLWTTYKFDLVQLSSGNLKPVFLLDGANEAPILLRRKKNGRCLLVEEIAALISAFRVVVTCRTEAIAIDYDAGEKMSGGDEFSNNVVYVSICELTDSQLQGVATGAVPGTALYNLLKNNMMLAMYLDLKSYGVVHENTEIKAGRLLEDYFTICFKTRYIRNILGDRLVSEILDDGQYGDLALNEEGKRYTCIQNVSECRDDLLRKSIKWI